MIDSLINESMSVQLIEALPKEKTAFIGSGGQRIGSQFLPIRPFKMNTTEDNIVKEPELKYEFVIPLTLEPLANAKAGKEQAADSQSAQVVIEISLSRPLVTAEYLEHGRFLTVEPFQMFPLPEEWAVKEVNEKDLNTNLYSYTISFLLPGYDRPLQIKNGRLAIKNVYSGSFV